MADHNVDWETCAVDGCVGVRLPTSGKCWAHAARFNLNRALKRLGDHGHLDARGVAITPKLLRRFPAATRDDHGHAILTDARFNSATFQGDAEFGQVTFVGDARFDRATFQGDARFSEATFAGFAAFNEVIFQRVARFHWATLQQDAHFGDVTFQGQAWFGWATFQGPVARFSRATFRRDAAFVQATFWSDWVCSFGTPRRRCSGARRGGDLGRPAAGRAWSREWHGARA